MEIIIGVMVADEALGGLLSGDRAVGVVNLRPSLLVPHQKTRKLLDLLVRGKGRSLCIDVCCGSHSWLICWPYSCEPFGCTPFPPVSAYARTSVKLHGSWMRAPLGAVCGAGIHQILVY